MRFGSTLPLLFLLIAPAVVRADPVPRVTNPAEGARVAVGARVPLEVAPEGTRVTIEGPARFERDGSLRVTGAGSILLRPERGGVAGATITIAGVSALDLELGADEGTPARPSLSRGDSGGPVRELQTLLDRALRAGDLGRVAVDGDFGRKTANALRTYQRAKGLAPTGAADAATWRSLEGSPAGDPARSGGPGGSGDASPAPAPAPDAGDLAHAGGTIEGRTWRRSGDRAARDVTVTRLPAVGLDDGKTTTPLAFTSSMTIDADGAGGWWKKDPDGKPRTSLRFPDGSSLDPVANPYVVLPTDFEAAHPGLALGDLVAVSANGRTVFAIVGDHGPKGRLGESSIGVARALGIASSPTSGGASGGASFVVFPGSGTGRGLSAAEVNRRGAALLAQLGPSRGLTGLLREGTTR